jgi:hypothetical protein
MKNQDTSSKSCNQFSKEIQFIIFLREWCVQCRKKTGDNNYRPSELLCPPTRTFRRIAPHKLREF